MKSKLLTFLAVGLLVAEASSGQEETAFRAGPNLAVQEANLKDGFKLSEKAKQVIGVKLKPLSVRPFVISNSALVHYGDRIGVYRIRDGWFKLIEVKQIRKDENSVVVDAADLQSSDRIAVEGVALLRVSEMDAFGGEQ